MPDIIVLGAGMVGVSTALALQARGHQVTLIDRREPGRETSFGNAGIIQVEAAEPYAMPRDLLTLMRYGFRQSNDLDWNLRGVVNMAPALWRYWRASSPQHSEARGAIYAQLTGPATEDHAPLIAEAEAEHLISRKGLALVFRQSRSFEAEAINAARLHDRYGVAFRTLAGTEWLREEPALRHAPAGVVHYTGCWSVSDPGALVTAYATLFERRGGRILMSDADGLTRTTTGWQILSEAGVIEASAVVLCLGPWTPALLRRVAGIRVPMVLKRGYHGHYDAPRRPGMPYLDADHGVVLSPMRQGLRMATGAALVPFASAPDPRQLDRAEGRVGDLIDLGPRIAEPQWFGTRPCLPGMLPMVGKVPGQPGLWVNFGHGHQGFTLGPTTARLLAGAMSGEVNPLQQAIAPERLLGRELPFTSFRHGR